MSQVEAPLGIIKRAEIAIREVFERRAQEYGNWITAPYPSTGAWSYEGEIATDKIVRAVLIAIREPSELMVQASGAERIREKIKQLRHTSWSYGSTEDLDRQTLAADADNEAAILQEVLNEVSDYWQAMIDAAVQELG